MKLLLETLIVKPENMCRNLERGGGLTTSESLVMALAEFMGRDRAHELVGELAVEARCSDVSFVEIVKKHPEVRKHLSDRKIDRHLDYRNYVGLSTHFVDRVLKAHQKAKRARRAKA